MKTIILLLALLMVSNSYASVTQIFITRHAEKQKGKDPSLTYDGVKRAEALIEIQDIFETKVEGVFSTTARRTIETATPLADENNLEIINDIPKKKPEILKEVILEKFKGKTVLVVGHTSTIPRLIRRFSRSLGNFKMTEDNFSRLFRILIDEKGNIEMTEYAYEAEDSGIKIRQL